VTKIKNGSSLVEKTGEAFSQVSTGTHKVKDLVAEIAAASKEQAQGVDQINRAANEMNRVVQQVAANAEESAAASRELTSQSDQMKEMMRELVTLVGGNSHSLLDDHEGQGDGRMVQGKLAAIRQTLKWPGKGKSLLTHNPDAEEVNPERIIPM
jgi:methyl-accepting chemotaxis protein